MSPNKKEMSRVYNRTMDGITKNMLPDNDYYFSEHEEGWNMFKILEDPKYKKKDDLMILIRNTEKR